MACNHSNAGVDTHDNESTPIAVVISQGIGDANTADFNVRFPSNTTFIFLILRYLLSKTIRSMALSSSSPTFRLSFRTRLLDML